MYFGPGNCIIKTHQFFGLREGIMPIFSNLTGLFSSPETAVTIIIARLLIATLILPFHELAHGWVANKMGDPTAKWMGRLTLNPLKHIDPIGSVLMLITGFGWAKPVPINPRNFKNERKGMAITAAAGPIANFIMAFVLLILAKLILIFYVLTDGAHWLYLIYSLVSWMVTINISLGVFNLCPIPPLDGYRIISLFLPDRIYYTIQQYEQYILYGFMALLMLTDFIYTPISYLSGLIANGLDFATGFMDLIIRALLGGA